MHQGYVCKAYPTTTQVNQLNEWFDSTRFVKNLAIEQRETYWARNKRKPTSQREACSYNTQAKDLKELRNDPVLAPFLKHVPAQVLQQALKDVNTAYEKFYRGQASYPTYYSKYRSKRSCRVPQGFQVKRVSRKWARVQLPLIGEVKIRYHKHFKGTVKSITVSQDRVGDYYLSFLTSTNENGKCARIRRKKARERAQATEQALLNDQSVNSIGLDRGIKINLMLSDQQQFDLCSLTTLEREKLKQLQVKESNQEKGSNRRKQTRQRINKLLRKATRRQQDHAQQISAHLIKNHDLVSIEDLRVMNMSKSNKGSVENPGKNVAQKRGLNRGIMEQAWGYTRECLEYKAERAGVILTCVPAAYSSQTCSECGHVSKANRRSQAVFKCVNCGYTANADLNAANIVDQRGLNSTLTQLQEQQSNKQCNTADNNHSNEWGGRGALPNTLTVKNVNTQTKTGSDPASESKKLVSTFPDVKGQGTQSKNTSKPTIITK